MKICQTSVFLENIKGRLYEVLNILSKSDINILALSIADTSEFGILRMIVNNPKKAKVVLTSEGLSVSENDVLAVGMSDSPGAFVDVLSVLKENNINVEYTYAFLSKLDEKAVMIIRTEDITETVELLNKNNIVLFGEDDLFNI